jgi:D-glycero-alpha-D-manno-heptose-7-phosphate kinase
VIISRTPLRVSFVGGGTDLPSFYRAHGGAVVSMAVDWYFYLSMHSYFGGDRSLLKYSRTELVSDPDEIDHRILREVFREHDVRGVDFASAADVPAGTGMGSSSSFTVGLLQLVNAWQGRYLPQSALAAKACEIEIDRLGEPIGKQDQYGAAIGGLKHIRFEPDDCVTVTPIFLKPAQRLALEASLMLFYLGNQRAASSVLAVQKTATETCGQVQQNLMRMAAQADELKDAITGDVHVLGEVLHAAWTLKRGLVQGITNSAIDDAYAAARAAGATGGKLLGAGAGGFLLICAPASRQPAIRAALSKLSLHRVKMDHSGTTIIYDDRSETVQAGQGQ